MSNPYLLLLLPGPAVGVEPEELLLALLVADNLLGAGGGAAQHGGHAAAAPRLPVALPHRLRRHSRALSNRLLTFNVRMMGGVKARGIVTTRAWP